MNTFDTHFFSQYLPEGHELIHIVHVHPVMILLRIILVLGLFVVIPSMFYYYSATIQGLLPFRFFEIYLILAYIKIIYDIFDWYNDVWMITSEGIVSVEWSLFHVNSDSLSIEHIEGMGVEKNSLLDMVLRKGDLIVHKFGEESYVLENAINPYKAVDLIEGMGAKKEAPSESEIDEGRFNEILRALSKAVEKHSGSQEQNMKTVEQDADAAKKQYLEKIKKAKGTIDLS